MGLAPELKTAVNQMTVSRLRFCLGPCAFRHAVNMVRKRLAVSLHNWIFGPPTVSFHRKTVTNKVDIVLPILKFHVFSELGKKAKSSKG